jgi:hypothetical protein
MTIRETLADIHALERQMLEFEGRYGVRSDVFYAAYRSREEPADDSWVIDFSEWAGVYQAWLERQAEYREAIDRGRRGGVSMASLVHAV